MTNKKLIDHCNSFWPLHRRGCLKQCPHIGYCDVFMAKYGATPFLENRFNNDRYTDEEIEKNEN